MADDRNVVDFTAMHNAAMAIDETAANLDNIKRGMVSTNEALEVHWTGEASAKYNQVFRAWNDQFQDIIKRLQDLHMALTGNRDLNLKNEQNNTPMINNIQNALTQV